MLSGAKIERFAHEDMDSLAKMLEHLDAKQAKAIAVDGVYSMEGHIASLPRLCELAEQHRAALVVDDAHGFGVLGRDGRGVCDHLGVTERVDLIAGSFSKSLASTGGFVAGSKALIEYLRSSSRQIIFSAAISPPAAASALAALRVIQEEPQHRERLWTNARYLRGILDESRPGLLAEPDAGAADCRRRQGKVLLDVEGAVGRRFLHGDVDRAGRSARQGHDSVGGHGTAHDGAARPIR